MLQTNTPKLDPREQHYWTAPPQRGLSLFLRHLAPPQRRGPGSLAPSARSISRDGAELQNARAPGGQAKRGGGRPQPTRTCGTFTGGRANRGAPLACRLRAG